MGKVFLTKNRILELTDTQSKRLAWWIFMMPSDRKLQLNGVEFCVDDIDLEALRKSKLPTQMKLEVRVKTVEKEKRKAME